MKITPETTFAQVERTQRLAHEHDIARAAAQSEAARELLAKAQAQGHEPDFWQRAVEFAESEEAEARRRLARFERRNRDAARTAHEFKRALSGAAERHFAKMQKATA